MPYHKGDHIIQGYQVEHYLPGGPLTELYVVRDPTNMLFEVEILPASLFSQRARQIAYRSLLFVAGIRHPCLSKSQGTIVLQVKSTEHTQFCQEVPLWDHATGRLPLQTLVDTIGPFHPAQAVEIILGVCSALLTVNKVSRNSTGNAFPHLALSPQTIALNESRAPVVLGWGNRAAFLTPIEQGLGAPRDRTAPYADPVKPIETALDTRHDVYALAACLFFLIKGSPPPDHVSLPSEAGAALTRDIEPILGRNMTKVLLHSLNTRITERPSMEWLTRELDAVQLELETFDFGKWHVCSVCGLMMKQTTDLCPLCIRDRILPTCQVPPAATQATSVPPSLTLPGRPALTSLEEIAKMLPDIVFHATMEANQAGFAQLLRKILGFLKDTGYREFIGDLLQDDGSLTEKPRWVASELAHRISPHIAEQVELSREKGAFIRWLKGRERHFRYRKTLKIDARIQHIPVDIVFRGMIYIFAIRPSFHLWEVIASLLEALSMPLVLIILRGETLSVPAHIDERITVYYGSPPRKKSRKKFWGSVDEYHLFSFVRGME